MIFLIFKKILFLNSKNFSILSLHQKPFKIVGIYGENMKDYIIKGITKDKNVRFFAVNSKQTLITAAQIHNLSVTNKVIFGRLSNAALMIAADLKNVSDQVTLVIESNGIIDKVLVTVDYYGNLKGYISNPEHETPLNPDTGTFDIKKASGSGYIKVIKELGLKTPYIGTVELLYGEIGQDLTYYFAKSEQIPTSMGVGVLIGSKGKILQSGGFMVQLLPDTPLEIVELLEKSLLRLPNFTDLLDMGYSIEKIMQEIILKDFEIEITGKKEIRYFCGCSKERFSNGIKLLGKEELQKSIQKNETLQAKCHFCNKVYDFTPQDIKSILDEITEDK